MRRVKETRRLRVRGRCIMVMPLPSKQETRVRFPPPAPVSPQYALVVNARDQERANKERVRFEEFDALAERGDDLSEDAHIVVGALAGYGGEGASGVGLAADGTNHLIPGRSGPKGRRRRLSAPIFAHSAVARRDLGHGRPILSCRMDDCDILCICRRYPC